MKSSVSYFPAAVIAALLSVAPGHASPPESSPPSIIRAFVEAFNAHDVDRMLAFVTDDVEWLSIDGKAVAVETEGKDALASSMKGYFASCATCRSELTWVEAAGSRVATLERAKWESKEGPRSQQSLAVYELRGGKIARVYYFPAEK